MAVLPFWPQRATLQHNVAHLAAFLVGASLCVAAVAGAAGRWVAVDYAAVPADGVPYSRGVWRSCRGAEPCADITPDKADDWERAVQALYVLTCAWQLVAVAVLYATAERELRELGACCKDFDKDTEAAAPTEGGESRPRKGASRRAMALAAGFMALGAAACGAAATAVFVVYQPVGGTADAARYEVHYKWGIVAWTAAWAATAVAAPLGWIAAL